LSTAPRIDIDPLAFWADPYPALKQMRKQAPIAFVPQLGSTIFTKRDDIFSQEKRIDVFSSHQPAGLMNRLMGHNMMRKDGDAHMAERAQMFPAVSPRVVKETWRAQFQAHADRILGELAPQGAADLVKAFALPLSAECLKDITGLTNMRYQDMDAWSQAMIDGIANYTGNAETANSDVATEYGYECDGNVLYVQADEPVREWKRQPETCRLCDRESIAKGLCTMHYRRRTKLQELSAATVKPEPRPAGAGSAGADWPQWRGPRRNGISEATGLLQEWHQLGISGDAFCLQKLQQGRGLRFQRLERREQLGDDLLDNGFVHVIP